MNPSIFISDLHLCSERSEIARTFFAFLQDRAAEAESLYILGDLFEYWAGDDDLDDPFNVTVVNALRTVHERGVALYVMHGNRDVLMGAAFVTASGAKLLTDPTLVRLHGVPTLLSHGDAFCTDDSEYQAFRAKVRVPQWQHDFLARPLAARKAEIEGMRKRSEHDKQGKTEAIMDVAASAVEQTLRQYGYPRLIHGHTHRPARHIHTVDGHRCERWVLADWYRRGSYLRCDESGCRAVEL
jgi:UDP-2,3-diacylglucosamine hydrolase